MSFGSSLIAVISSVPFGVSPVTVTTLLMLPVKTAAEPIV